MVKIQKFGAFRRNIVANAAGHGWSGLLGLLVVPFYLRLLGTEAFGLIVFFASVQSLLVVLDLGLSATANREVARGVAQGWSPTLIWQRVRALELFYFAVGGLLALILGVAAYLYAPSLFNASLLSNGLIRSASAIVGVTIGFRWPIALYYGVIRGLERQVPLNAVTVFNATVRHLGALVAVLIAQALSSSHSILVFFSWQLMAALIEVAALALMMRRVLPRSSRSGAIEWSFIRRSFGFSSRLAGISMFAAILKQMDKFVIAKLLSLEVLGYYAVATTITGALALIVSPVVAAAYPRLSALLAEANQVEASRVYHRASQLVAALTAPAAVVLLLFAHDIIFGWTRSITVSTGAAPALTVLAAAALLNSLMQIPYALQLASGETWISLAINGSAVFLLSPIMFLLVSRYGILGGAYTWLLFNVLYMIILPQLLHRRVLEGHKATWYTRDNLPFVVAAFVCYGIARWIELGPTFARITAASFVYGYCVLLAWSPQRGLLSWSSPKT